MIKKNPLNEKNTLPFTALKNILLLRSCKRKRSMKHISAPTFKLGNRLSRLNRNTFSFSMKPSSQKMFKIIIKNIMIIKVIRKCKFFFSRNPRLSKKNMRSFFYAKLWWKRWEKQFHWNKDNVEYITFTHKPKIENLKKMKATSNNNKKKNWLISDRKGKHSK